MTPREWFRRLCFGLDTVLSLERLGFFIPYRHARLVTPPQHYPAIAAMFEEALPEMAAAIDAIEAVAEDLKKIARDAKAPAPRWDQDWFCGLDAAMLYAQIRQHRPARVVEIGSGHSTRFAARAIADGELETQLIAIDPEPRADMGALKVEWHRETLQQALQNSGGHVIAAFHPRSEEHTSELQSLAYLVCRLLLEKKNKHRSKERPDRTRRSHLTLPLRQAHTPPYRR